MEYKFNDMCSWERRKACFLIEEAERLGMGLEGYGELAVNPNSGYTYLWLEDYTFTLFMPINCELKTSDVSAIWTNPENGEETEISIEGMSLEDLENWANEMSKKAENQDEE